jgi:hypothetical protein
MASGRLSRPGRHALCADRRAGEGVWASGRSSSQRGARRRCKWAADRRERSMADGCRLRLSLNPVSGIRGRDMGWAWYGDGRWLHHDTVSSAAAATRAGYGRWESGRSPVHMNL